MEAFEGRDFEESILAVRWLVLGMITIFHVTCDFGGDKPGFSLSLLLPAIGALRSGCAVRFSLPSAVVSIDCRRRGVSCEEGSGNLGSSSS